VIRECVAALLFSVSGIAAGLTQPAVASKPLDEIVAFMAEAKAKGRVRIARKTLLVDARPARVGEVVVTAIKGEGKETQSRPAAAGDWVVRNRCPETGNEQYLVGADKFKERYKATSAPAGAEGWQEVRPLGKEVRFVILDGRDGISSFIAPWGEPMAARPGDALVQDPADEKDVYRVAQASFACTYEVVR
jgi:hypothetical protein